MAVRVDVEPRVLQWARDRSSRDPDELNARFPDLAAWEQRDRKPTLRQLEEYAAATYVPLGYLLLPEPPRETLPIPDYRTVRDARLERPSANLLDVIYQCQIRQDWYREYALANDFDQLAFVGSISRATTSANQAAALLREALDFGIPRRLRFSTWSAAVAGLAASLENVGVLVMISGVVGSNTTRVLDPDEFRGFTLADDLAPVIFVNGADWKAAQLFTVAHEAAHLWLGDSGISNATPSPARPLAIERWCNAVAGELLVPIEDLRLMYRTNTNWDDQMEDLAKRYKASTLTVLRRIYDAGLIEWDRYRAAYELELARAEGTERPAQGGGNFYNTLPVRASKRFVRAVVGDAVAGRTLYRDAFRMLGLRKQGTFDELGRKLGVI